MFDFGTFYVLWYARAKHKTTTRAVRAINQNASFLKRT